MKKFKYIMFTVLLGSLLLFGLSGCGSQGTTDQDTLVGPENPIVTPPVPSNTPPTITLIGANPVNLNVGDTFTDPGATANDKEDGDLTSKITVTGTVDTTQVGTYTLTYKVTDSGGLSETVSRTVNVTAPSNTPPTITLIGANPLRVTACDPYVEPGATATDQEDGNLTSKIVIDNSAVDTNTLGTYEVIYTVQDSDGAKAEVKRTVEVVTTLVNSKVIPQTGQTKSYDEAGIEVSRDCSLKDDGFYQAGVARNFVRTEINITAGMVEDTVTGLVWEDTEHASLSSADPSTDPKLLTQIDAKTYCSNLSLGGKTWRLPNVWELTTIANKAEYDPAIEDVFKFYSLYAQGYTWSNTDDVLSTGNVWIVNFKTGVDVDSISPKGSKYSTRCVFGTEFKPAATYTKDPATNIISSDKTGLEWADDDLTAGGSETWKAAIDFCEALTAGGYSDWRLPNINEYYSIFDYDQNKLVFNVSTTEKMWSSTTAAPGYTGFDTAWVMKKSKGDSTPIGKSNPQPFMCVRNK